MLRVFPVKADSGRFSEMGHSDPNDVLTETSSEGSFDSISLYHAIASKNIVENQFRNISLDVRSMNPSPFSNLSAIAQGTGSLLRRIEDKWKHIVDDNQLCEHVFIKRFQFVYKQV